MISIIIPTYKRRDDLLRCMASLENQSIEHNAFEILIVDNAADPELESDLQKLRGQSSLNLRYIPEPTLGNHHARHTGARSAHGDLLIFMDDDTTPDPELLQAYRRRFEANLDLAAAGGPILPVWQEDPPTWLTDLIHRSGDHFPPLALMDRGDKALEDPNGFFFSANMAIRLKALVKGGGFRPEAFGAKWLGNGESGLNRRLRELGLQVGYVPEAVMHHHIPARRMTLDYLAHWNSNAAASDAFALYHPHIPRFPRLCGDLLRLVLHQARLWVAFPLSRRDPQSPTWLDRWMRYHYSKARARYVLELMTSQKLRDLVRRQDWFSMDEVK